MGEDEFNSKFARCPVVIYTRNQKDFAYYKRTTPLPDNFNAYRLFTEAWISDDNLLNSDFELYSSFDDMKQETNQWQFCNYDDPDVSPRDCALNEGNPWMWFSMYESSHHISGITNEVSFEVCDASAEDADAEVGDDEAEVEDTEADDEDAEPEVGDTKAGPGIDWKNVKGDRKHVSVGPHGEVWAIKSDDRIYYRSKNSSSWEEVSGKLSQISIGANGLVAGVNKSGGIYIREGTKGITG